MGSQVQSVGGQASLGHKIDDEDLFASLKPIPSAFEQVPAGKVFPMRAPKTPSPRGKRRGSLPGTPNPPGTPSPKKRKQGSPQSWASSPGPMLDSPDRKSSPGAMLCRPLRRLSLPQQPSPIRPSGAAVKMASILQEMAKHDGHCHLNGELSGREFLAVFLGRGSDNENLLGAFEIFAKIATEEEAAQKANRLTPAQRAQILALVKQGDDDQKMQLAEALLNGDADCQCFDQAYNLRSAIIKKAKDADVDVSKLVAISSQEFLALDADSCLKILGSGAAGFLIKDGETLVSDQTLTFIETLIVRLAELALKNNTTCLIKFDQTKVNLRKNAKNADQKQTAKDLHCLILWAHGLNPVPLGVRFGFTLEVRKNILQLDSIARKKAKEGVLLSDMEGTVKETDPAVFKAIQALHGVSFRILEGMERRELCKAIPPEPQVPTSFSPGQPVDTKKSKSPVDSAKALRVFKKELADWEKANTPDFWKAKLTDALQGQPHIAGIDWRGPETEEFVAKHIENLVRALLDLGKAQQPSKRLICRFHVGEGYAADGKTVNSEIAASNIETVLTALEKLPSDLEWQKLVEVRFGHATHANGQQLMRAAKLGIVIEVNLSSNLKTRVIGDIAKHPLMNILLFVLDNPEIWPSLFVFGTDGGGIMGGTIKDQIRLLGELLEALKAQKAYIRNPQSPEGEQALLPFLNTPGKKCLVEGGRLPRTPVTKTPSPHKIRHKHFDIQVKQRLEALLTAVKMVAPS
jgi:hypothetical protein